MISLYLASASELDELRSFRARVYEGELGIQEDTYQDVFNDHFSKNIVLRESGRLVGTVRLAFSREKQEFYISYLTVESDKRKHTQLGLLLGAFFLLMKRNQLQTVRGDSADGNLEMYLTAGCRVIGPKFHKYGFMCEWTPMSYTLGTNAVTEKRLMDHALKYMGWEGSAWRFKPRLLLCADLDSYNTALDELIATRQIFSLTPHLCTNREVLSNLGSSWLDAPTLLGPEVLPPISPGQSALKFEDFNRHFNTQNLILVRRHSPLKSFAQMYGMLSGKTLVAVDDWAALNLDQPEQVASVLLIVEPDEARTAVKSLRTSLPDVTCGIATGADGEAVSWFLLKNYFRFIGPAEHGEPLVSRELHTHARLLVIPVNDSESLAGAAVSHALHLLDGSTSHLVCVGTSHFEEAFLMLSCLCETGYTIGEAVQFVSAAIGGNSRAGNDSDEKLWLFGDPNLRLLPPLPNAVESAQEAFDGSWKVTLKHNGPDVRMYHVKLETNARFTSFEPGGNGIHRAVCPVGSTQHLFAYARTALPKSLTVILD
jgi:hypothetical protein